MRRAWLALLLLAVSGTARADLRSAPAWYDPTWHYRVPISIPAASAVNSMIVVDALGLDLSDAFARKLEANAAKYPVAKASGSARKYTELG